VRKKQLRRMFETGGKSGGRKKNSPSKGHLRGHTRFSMRGKGRTRAVDFFLRGDYFTRKEQGLEKRIEGDAHTAKKMGQRYEKEKPIRGKKRK